MNLKKTKQKKGLKRMEHIHISEKENNNKKTEPQIYMEMLTSTP